jgi:hypothetical protein
VTRQGVRASRGYLPHNRETTWARSVNLFAFAANGNYQTFDVLAPFKTAGGQQQGVTVTRTYIDISVTTAVAAGDTFSWALIKGQASDVGANIAGASTADQDFYEDYLMWRYETACDGLNNNSYWGPANNYSFDIRAQRRLPDLHQSLNLVARRITTGAALSITMTVSCLLKLP